MTTSRRFLLALAALLVAGIAVFVSMREPSVPSTDFERPAERTDAPTVPEPRHRTATEVSVVAEPGEPIDDDVPKDTKPERALRLLDGRGEPVSGVYASGSGGSGFTDEKGEVSFAATDAPGAVEFFDGEKDRSVELAATVTEVRLADVPTLTVGIMDGSTGEPMSGVRWRSSARSWHDARPVDAPSLGLALDRKFCAKACVRVEPPEGFGALDTYEWEGEVASRAKTVSLLVPIYPAREISFRIVDVDGRPLPGAGVVWADTPLGGYNPTDVTHRAGRSDAAGLLRVEGVPRVPFARLRVHVARVCEDDDSYELGATADGIVLDEPASPEPLKLVLTRREREFREWSGGGGSGCGSSKKPDFVAPLSVRAVTATARRRRGSRSEARTSAR